MTRPFKARLGIQGHAAVLVRLKSKPSTYDELFDAELLGSHSSGHRLLASLHKLMRIHICGWREGRSRPIRAVWAYGFGVDVPAPARRSNGKRRVHGPYIPTIDCIPPAYLALDMLMSELESAKTAAQLQASTGLDFRTVRAALRGLSPLLLTKQSASNATIFQMRETACARQSRAVTGDARFLGASSIFTLAANEERRAA